MVRLFFTYVLPLALPTLLYFAWSAWVRKKVAAAHALDPDQNPDAETMGLYDIQTPWFRLAIAGVSLMVLGLVLSVVLAVDNPPGSVYQPPRLENGQVIPGQYVPKPQ